MKRSRDERQESRGKGSASRGRQPAGSVLYAREERGTGIAAGNRLIGVRRDAPLSLGRGAGGEGVPYASLRRWRVFTEAEEPMQRKKRPSERPSPLTPLPRERGTGIGTVLATAALLAGCGPSALPTDDGFALAKARAAVAFAAAEVAASRADDASPSPEPERPAEPVAEERPVHRRRLLYFTAAWCPACRRNEPTFAALAAAGWRIGSGEEGHIQTIDLDARPDLAARYGVRSVPTWVLTDAGRELRRRVGVLAPFAVGRLFEE